MNVKAIPLSVNSFNCKLSIESIYNRAKDTFKL